MHWHLKKKKMYYITASWENNTQQEYTAERKCIYMHTNNSYKTEWELYGNLKRFLTLAEGYLEAIVIYIKSVNTYQPHPHCGLQSLIWPRINAGKLSFKIFFSIVSLRCHSAALFKNYLNVWHVIGTLQNSLQQFNQINYCRAFALNSHLRMFYTKNLPCL